MIKCISNRVRKNKGFSLAELMLVLLVMAIMITLIVTQGGRIVDYVQETLTKMEARQFMSQAQVAISQGQALGIENTTLSFNSSGNAGGTNTALGYSGAWAIFQDLAGTNFKSNDGIDVRVSTSGDIVYLMFSSAQRGKTATFQNDVWTVGGTTMPTSPNSPTTSTVTP